MRVIAIGVLVLCSYSLKPQGQAYPAATQAISTVYLVTDETNNRWCAFRTRAVWKSRVESGSAMTVGSITYVGRRPSVIILTQTDETGDWIVEDHYSTNRTGQLQRLKRRINVIPGDRSELQTFLIKDGKAIKRGSISRKLSTLKATREPADWLPDVPIITRIDDFAFYELIGHGMTKWPQPELCIEAGEQTPRR